MAESSQPGEEHSCQSQKQTPDRECASRRQGEEESFQGIVILDLFHLSGCQKEISYAIKETKAFFLPLEHTKAVAL